MLARTASSVPFIEFINVIGQLSKDAETALVKELYLSWIEQHPDDPMRAAAEYNYGTFLMNLGESALAEDAFRAAIRHRPDFMPPYFNLGTLLESRGATALAVTEWLHVVNHLAGVHATSITHKTMALKQIGRTFENALDYRQAEEMYRQSLEINPAQHDVLEHWIVLRQKQCAWPVMKSSERLSPQTMLKALSPLSLARYADTPMLQLALAYNCYAHTSESSAGTFCVGQWPASNTLRPDRLRIGYVSSDLRSHAVGSLIAGVFELHNHQRFEIFAYNTGVTASDPVRARIGRCVDYWRDIGSMRDRPAAAQIIRDGIDILIDINGFTEGGRTALFALRPAPVIVNWLGYPGTSGSPHHHYIIADMNIIPPHLEKYYSETVRRLPCYQPNDRSREINPHPPSRSDVGLPENAFVYCCFNATEKLTQHVFQLWMTILRQVPHAVIWLLSESGVTQENLWQRATEHGVAPQRLIFAERCPPAEHLSRYRLADLFLDTYPYGAHTTGSDALWMGLPVITLCGHSFASRVCASLVQNSGLAKLVCGTEATYVETAVRLGYNRLELEGYRLILEAARHDSVAFDTAKLVRHLEALYDEMWGDYASGRLPSPDLTNLAIYMQEGLLQDHTSTSIAPIGDYEQYYHNAFAYRHAISPIAHDRRLWPAP